MNKQEFETLRDAAAIKYQKDVEGVTVENVVFDFTQGADFAYDLMQGEVESETRWAQTYFNSWQKAEEREKNLKAKICELETLVDHLKNGTSYRILELEDKLYHESRNAPEVEYKLGHKIEQLEAKLAICKAALEDMTWSVDRRTAGIAKGTLAQLEGKAE